MTKKELDNFLLYYVEIKARNKKIYKGQLKKVENMYYLIDLKTDTVFGFTNCFVKKIIMAQRI